MPYFKRFESNRSSSSKLQSSRNPFKKHEENLLKLPMIMLFF